MPRSLTLAGVAATLLAVSATAQAQQPMQRVQVGILECRGGASVGFIVGSVTNLGCVLRAEGLPEDRYVATIRKVGLDLGITQETALAWGVFAPSVRLGPGALSGDYAGVQGSAALGVGAGGNVLVGGSNNTIALQPLRARSASASPPDWRAWSCGRGGEGWSQRDCGFDTARRMRLPVMSGRPRPCSPWRRPCYVN